MKKKFIIHAVLVIGLLQVNAQGNNNKPVKPVEKTVVLSTGVTMQYAEQGKKYGTPVIFIHGITDSWHSFESVMAYLPSYLHVYALTMRGHGNSSRPAAGYRPKDFAADIAAFIKEKKLGSAVIVGHSMGGVIAQQLALDFPTLTRGLVIVDSDAAFKENPDLEEFFKEISRLTDPVPFEFADTFQKSTLANPIDTVYYGKLVNETLKVPAHVWKAAMKGIMEINFLATTLVSYTKPVQIFWGDRDFITPYQSQERLKQVFPSAGLNIYVETGHALHWERPERFARDLCAFIGSTKR